MRQFFFSLILHGLLLCIMLFGLSRPQQPSIVNKGEKIIHATAIENTQVKALEKKIQDQKIQQQQAQAEKQHQLQEQAKQAEAQRVAEQKHAEDVKIAAQKKIEDDKAIALQKQKDIVEKKRLEALEKQKKIDEEKLKLQKIKEKEAADKAAAKKADDAAKKLKDQQKKQYEAAAALQQQIAAKQAAIAQQRSQAINGIVDQYKGLILEAIAQQWLVPPGTDPSLASQLMITLGAGGKVQNVQLVKSSGNALLDQSAVAAVYKASPLPMPPDADAAAVFKQFSLTLKPEQMLDS